MRGTRGSRTMPASEPCTLYPPELERRHPTKLVVRRASPVGGIPRVKVRPFGAKIGGAYGVQASWKHGAYGLRAVPGVHDLRAGGGRGGVKGYRRTLP